MHTAATATARATLEPPRTCPASPPGIPVPTERTPPSRLIPNSLPYRCDRVRPWRMATLDAPQWFIDAIARQPEHASVEVDGRTVEYRRWGAVDRPGLVLVHGGAAHAGGWDHVAP